MSGNNERGQIRENKFDLVRMRSFRQTTDRMNPKQERLVRQRILKTPCRNPEVIDSGNRLGSQRLQTRSARDNTGCVAQCRLRLENRRATSCSFCYTPFPVHQEFPKLPALLRTKIRRRSKFRFPRSDTRIATGHRKRHYFHVFQLSISMVKWNRLTLLLQTTNYY